MNERMRQYFLGLYTISKVFKKNISSLIKYSAALEGAFLEVTSREGVAQKLKKFGG